MNLYELILNLASGYGFDATSEDSPVRVTALEAGTAAEITVDQFDQSFVVTGDNVRMAALARLFHSVNQFSRSRTLLRQAFDTAAPFPAWAE